MTKSRDLGVKGEQGAIGPRVVDVNIWTMLCVPSHHQTLTGGFMTFVNDVPLVSAYGGVVLAFRGRGRRCEQDFQVLPKGVLRIRNEQCQSNLRKLWYSRIYSMYVRY